MNGEIGDGLAHRLLAARLLEVHEHIELVLQDARGIGHRIVRTERAVGLDLHGQLVVVENLPSRVFSTR